MCSFNAFDDYSTVKVNWYILWTRKSLCRVYICYIWPWVSTDRFYLYHVRLFHCHSTSEATLTNIGKIYHTIPIYITDTMKIKESENQTRGLCDGIYHKMYGWKNVVDAWNLHLICAKSIDMLIPWPDFVWNLHSQPQLGCFILGKLIILAVCNAMDQALARCILVHFLFTHI